MHSIQIDNQLTNRQSTCANLPRDSVITPPYSHWVVVEINIVWGHTPWLQNVQNDTPLASSGVHYTNPIYRRSRIQSPNTSGAPAVLDVTAEWCPTNRILNRHQWGTGLFLCKQDPITIEKLLSSIRSDYQQISDFNSSSLQALQSKPPSHNTSDRYQNKRNIKGDPKSII